MNKDEAVKNMVAEVANCRGFHDHFDIPGPLIKRELQDHVGQWLVKKYEEQHLVQNYLKDVPIYKKRIVDVFVLRYHLEPNSTSPQ